MPQDRGETGKITDAVRARRVVGIRDFLLLKRRGLGMKHNNGNRSEMKTACYLRSAEEEKCLLAVESKSGTVNITEAAR